MLEFELVNFCSCRLKQWAGFFFFFLMRFTGPVICREPVQVNKRGKKTLFSCWYEHANTNSQSSILRTVSRSKPGCVPETTLYFFWKLFFPLLVISQRVTYSYSCFQKAAILQGVYWWFALLIAVLVYLLSCLDRVIYQCVTVLGFWSAQDLHILQFLTFFIFFLNFICFFGWS